MSCFNAECRPKMLYVLLLLMHLMLQTRATDDPESEPFEPFAFELESDDESGFISNYTDTNVSIQQPPTGTDNSTELFSSQFPIGYRPVGSQTGKASSLMPDSSEPKKPVVDVRVESQEFQSENESDKVESSQIVNSEFLLNPGLNASKDGKKTALCDIPGDIPTFIKHSQVLHKVPAVLSMKMENLRDCALNCRNKISLNGDKPFDCHGFSFLGWQSNNKCEFYTQHVFEYASAEKHESRSVYFERICLPIARECATSAYSFEIQPERLLAIKPVREQVVENRKQCLDFCLTHQDCRSVNFNKINGTCQLLDKVPQNFMMSLSEDTEFDYYENMCLQDRQTCESGQRTDFVLTKNSQVSFGNGLDVNLGYLSVANCMRECVETTLIFCRSFQYDPATRECLLVEETGVNALRSEQYDLYEPVCLNSEIDIPCPGDRVFERMPHTNLVSENVLAHLKEVSLGACMEACLFDENCLSFTYNRPEQRCKILALNRRNSQTLTVVETSIDYYELACDRKAILKKQQVLVETVSPDLFSTRQPSTTESQRRLTLSLPTTELQSKAPRHVCDISQSVIVESGRTLRIDYRNLHHVNVHSLDRCQGLCAEASSIKCATFAYNYKTGDCLISSTTIDKNNRFSLVTQPNPNFDLYSFLGGSACSYNETTANSLVTSTTVQQTTLSAYENSSQALTTEPTLIQPTVAEFTATMYLSDPFDEESRSRTDTAPVVDLTLAAFVPSITPHHSFRDPKPEPLLDADVEVESTTKRPPVYTTPSQITRRSTEKPRELTTTTTTTTTTTATMTTTTTVADSTPIQTVQTSTVSVLPHRDKSIERLLTHKIHVAAMCLERGINVSFNIENGNYTGAVYAAERFSQCRIFVEGQNSFSIFVTRPSVNNLCNALEEDGELTAVLVMSNDMVLPYDVTTKDDFFYQITCDYSKGEHNSVIKTGIVVGGPEPKSVMSSSRKSDEKQNRVFLKILKNQRPVTKVYIGEKLTAVVESDLDATRLRITDCNATRVGGHEPRPNSVQLIKDGCSVMPQIIGNIERGSFGLEASFTAFRIDGSDQIDIVCGIIVCRQRCDDKSPKCPSRTRRNTDDTVGNEMIIDQRLQVLVDDRQTSATNAGESDEQPSQSLLHMILSMDPAKTEYCMNPMVFLIFLSVFLLTIVALVISFTVLLCRRRSMRFPYSSHRLHIPRIECYIAENGSF